MYHALLWIIRGQPGHWTYVADGLSHKLVESDWLTRNSLSPKAPGFRSDNCHMQQQRTVKTETFVI